MDLTIIRIHVKKILTGNFVFMSLVAIIFGILTLFSKGQEKIIGSYTYIDMLWKGYIFLYIIFAPYTFVKLAIAQVYACFNFSLLS